MTKNIALLASAAAFVTLAVGQSHAITINLSGGSNAGPWTLDAGNNTFNSPSATTAAGEIDGVISGPGNLRLVSAVNSNNPVRRITINTQATYDGTTTVRSDNARFGVAIGVDNALPTGTTLLFETSNQGSGRPAWFDLNGFSQEVAGIGDNTATTYNAIVNGDTGIEGSLIVNNAADINYDSRLGATVGHSNITSSATGIFDGEGDNFRLTKRGSGLLNIVLNFSYTGNTAVEAGALEINNASLADASDVLLTTGATFKLDFVGTDDINALFIDDVPQALGTWGALGSGADHTTVLITGTGLLNVAVPEPASLALLGLGGLMVLRRR